MTMMTIMTLTTEMALDMPLEMLVHFLKVYFLKCICAQLLVREELIGAKLFGTEL